MELFAVLSRGGFVMIPLLLCSLVSLAVIVERALFWRGEAERSVPDRVLALAEAGRLEEARLAVGEGRTGLSRVLAAGLTHGNPAAADAMEAAALAELPRMRQYLPALDTIVTLAPLLGLLGTITGMIDSFGILGAAGIGQPHAITGGIAEALIATATGLFVAIVTLVPYNAYLARGEREAERIEHYATRLLLALKGSREP